MHYKQDRPLDDGLQLVEDDAQINFRSMASPFKSLECFRVFFETTFFRTANQKFTQFCDSRNRSYLLA